MDRTYTILVVDDQVGLLDHVKLTLEMAGYRVTTARDGLEALDVLESQRVDLILADIAMPRLNGYQLHQRVTGNPMWVAIPFLFLTARAMDSDIRYGKELGADDYLTKPIEPEDLLAAVRGRLLRMERLAQSRPTDTAEPLEGPDVLDFGNLRIAPCQFRIWRHGRRVEVSAREFRLLECLAERASRVVPVGELIKATHGLETDRAEAGALVRPMIRSLRRKLGYPAGDMGCIENVRGVGYQFVPYRN